MAFALLLAGWVVLYGFAIPSPPLLKKSPVESRLLFWGEQWRGPYLGQEVEDRRLELGLFGAVTRYERANTRYYLTEGEEKRELSHAEAEAFLQEHHTGRPLPPPTFVVWRFRSKAVGMSLLFAWFPAVLTWLLWRRGAAMTGAGVALQAGLIAGVLGLAAFPAFVGLGRPAPPLGLVPPDLALALTLLAMGVGCAVWRRARASHTTSSHG